MALIIEFPKPSGNTEPDAEIVEMLESLLERVRSGEVQSVVVVSAGTDGNPECGMGLDRGQAPAIIGALHVAAAKITKLLDVDVS
jgi:hypothetical protein